MARTLMGCGLQSSYSRNLSRRGLSFPLIVYFHSNFTHFPYLSVLVLAFTKRWSSPLFSYVVVDLMHSNIASLAFKARTLQRARTVPLVLAFYYYLLTSSFHLSSPVAGGEVLLLCFKASPSYSTVGFPLRVATFRWKRVQNTKSSDILLLG